MPDNWKVFKCVACGMCHGRKSTGHNCPHCGQRTSDSTPVVDRAEHPSELRMKVVLANTPPELRESLAQKLSESDHLINSNSSFTPVRGLNELRKLVDANGKVTLDEISNAFRKKGFQDSLDEFLIGAEAQGVILRLGDGIWRFLE